MNDMFDIDDKYWVVDITACAEYLSDEEFETLQGLIKKVDILSNDSSQYYVVRYKGEVKKKEVSKGDD